MRHETRLTILKNEINLNSRDRPGIGFAGFCRISRFGRKSLGLKQTHQFPLAQMRVARLGEKRLGQRPLAVLQ
jgi:hypothetical protein